MRKTLCNRERRTTVIIWIVPWIFAGIISVLLVAASSGGKKRQIVHTQNSPVNTHKNEPPVESEQLNVTSDKAKEDDIWPEDDMKSSFEWVDAIWKQSTELPHPKVKKFDVEVFGNLHESILKMYNTDVPVAAAQYAEIPFAYVGDSGYAITNKLPYPQHGAYLYDLDPQVVLASKRAETVNNAIFLPYFSKLTWPMYNVLFLPALMSLPSNIRASAVVLITAEPPGFRDVLMNVGFRGSQIQPLKGWIKGENMIVFQHPDPEKYFMWEMRHFAKLQQKTFSNKMFRTISVCTTWEATISNEKMEEMMKILNKADKRIVKMPEWNNNRIRHMECFYRSPVVIGFSSNFLYYLPFMKPESLAIVVQSSYSNLQYISLAREMGVRVVVIGVDDMSNLDNSVCTTILDVIKKYAPAEDLEEDHDDDDK